ncbi:hypothetical protein [Xanthocytophaga agilis]|uniref:Uncharacterized protein n=1 Tax=Xanthocytophaga agilis TaxID=3048010 RepID=A0AAE3R8I2_9BACT|nr:hypothetical protein [Xanthocytophaga agilis]MDJ1503532.1 hypothetical protein [Xanthocytophaga agilis]
MNSSEAKTYFTSFQYVLGRPHTLKLAIRLPYVNTLFDVFYLFKGLTLRMGLLNSMRICTTVVSLIS